MKIQKYLMAASVCSFVALFLTPVWAQGLPPAIGGGGSGAGKVKSIDAIEKLVAPPVRYRKRIEDEEEVVEEDAYGEVRLYQYASAEAEYVVALPDAPLAETIWAQDGDVPYLENPLKYGAVGEYAIVRRVDPKEGDFFFVRVAFVKADREFLLDLTAETIEKTLQTELKDITLQDATFSLSEGHDTLKWGTYSGYSVNRNNDIIFNIVHYLAGVESVMTIRVGYSVYNKTFNKYYKALSSSIKFMGK